MRYLALIEQEGNASVLSDNTILQAHEAIRADPSFEKKERSAPSEKKSWKPKKLTYEERKANLKVCSHLHF